MSASKRLHELLEAETIEIAIYRRALRRRACSSDSGLSERVDALDPELRRRIEERAYALWGSEARPEARAMDYWLQAEQEIVNQSMAAEEDPLADFDQETA